MIYGSMEDPVSKAGKSGCHVFDAQLPLVVLTICFFSAKETILSLAHKNSFLSPQIILMFGIACIVWIICYMFNEVMIAIIPL